MRLKLALGVFMLPVLLAACTTMPDGPGVMVLPGSSKSFEQFRSDDMECRNHALKSVGGTTAGQAATQSGVRSAVVGTVIGAAAGAAIGGQDGAAVGAGSGLLIGGLAGTETARVSGYTLQRRYDVAYVQCMYAKGHQVPVSGRVYRQPWQERYLPQALPPGIPPPPAGTPPPPPPDIRAR